MDVSSVQLTTPLIQFCEWAHPKLVETHDKVTRVFDGVRDHLVAIDETLADLPTFSIQDRADEVGRLIKEQCAHFERLNGWLDENGWDSSRWYKDLFLLLLKLPLRAARNVVRMLYRLIETIAYTCVHPLRSLNALAEQFVQFVRELTKPETWSRLGIGLIGLSCGQTIITGNPLSVLGIGLGCAMLVGGVSFGALQAAVLADTDRFDAVKHNILSQAVPLSESLLTGLCFGLLFGAIQGAKPSQQHVEPFLRPVRPGPIVRPL